MSRYTTDAAIALTVLAILATWCVRAWIHNIRARRNERQLTDHIRMGHGMREADRRGWLDDIR